MMLIDFHTHCFPERIAARAVDKLAFSSGGLQNYTDGTLDGLTSSMERAGVDISVVLSIATNEHQQRSVNDFACEMDRRQDIVAFGSVFPHGDSALDELERIKAMGMKGVKLHPDYQGFFADDEKMKPLYKKISSLGLITVFHAGFDYGFAPPYGGTPERIANALEWFDTPVVAAHWGGINCIEDVLKYLCGSDVYFDTSFGYSMMPRYYAQKIMEKHGADRFVFGTDTPWHTPEMEMRLLDNLGLSETEKEKIFAGNAKKLLNIEQNVK